MLRFFVMVFMSALVFQSTAGSCVEPATGDTYETGDQWKPPGQCQTRTCHSSGAYSALGCPLVQAGKGYTMSEEIPELPYPTCCPKPVPADPAAIVADLRKSLGQP